MSSGWAPMARTFMGTLFHHTSAPRRPPQISWRPRSSRTERGPGVAAAQDRQRAQGGAQQQVESRESRHEWAMELGGDRRLVSLRPGPESGVPKPLEVHWLHAG